MTLPASGQIAASDVNVELSKGSTDYITLNDTNVRALAGVTGANTTIRLPQDFWGKSVAATYSVAPTASSVDEGSSVTFNVSGTSIANGTYYWTVTNPGDFDTSSGSFTITSNAGSFIVGPTADSTTEGAESFTASVRTGSTSGTIVATSSSVTINDTSTSPSPPPPPPPPGPIYNVTPLVTSRDEGVALQFNITGSNIPNGTHYWRVGHISTNAADFAADSGSFDILSNEGVFFLYPSADLITEGNETFNMTIRTGSTSGPIVATSTAVTLIDTSTTPPAGFTPFSNLGGLGNTSWSGTTGLWSAGNQIFEQRFIEINNDGTWNIYANSLPLLRGSGAYGSPTGENAANSYYCRFTRTSYTAAGGGATSGSSVSNSTGWLAISSNPFVFLSLQSSIPVTTTATFTVEVSPNASGSPVAGTASNITLTITAS
jgi:hypothetical protein